MSKTKQAARFWSECVAIVHGHRPALAEVDNGWVRLSVKGETPKVVRGKEARLLGKEMLRSIPDQDTTHPAFRRVLMAMANSKSGNVLNAAMSQMTDEQVNWLYAQLIDFVSDLREQNENGPNRESDI